jgi:hypothetical protein
MPVQTGMSASIGARAFLVFGVLVCLCVSSNVGLQLFPLPAALHCIAENTHQDINAQTSFASESEAYSFRVPMVQSPKPVDQERPQVDSLIAWSVNRSDFPVDTRFAIETCYPVFFSSPVLIMPSAGRAPPSLI